MTLTAEDIREGVVGILSLYVPEPQFQGQTKDRLNNPEVGPLVEATVRLGARAVAAQERAARPTRSCARIITGRARARGEPRGERSRCCARRRSATA